MKELIYKITGVNGESIESDSVLVGSPKDWVAGQRAECAARGWEIAIWDNEGNSY